MRETFCIQTSAGTAVGDREIAYEAGNKTPFQLVWVRGGENTSMTTLSPKERSLARHLAKGPYYSYGITSVARLLGVKKSKLLALAQSLGEKTGDPVQRSQHAHYILATRMCNIKKCIAGKYFYV